MKFECMAERYERVRVFQEEQELMSTFIESKDQRSRKRFAFVNSVKKNRDRNPLSVSILRKKSLRGGFPSGIAIIHVMTDSSSPR